MTARAKSPKSPKAAKAVKGPAVESPESKGSEVISLKTIEDLASHFDAPEEFIIRRGGKNFTVTLFPVRDEAGEADKLIDILPPEIEPAKPGKPAVYDENDKDFRKRLRNAWELRRAFFIEKGSSLAPIPGHSWEAKAEYLRKHFPIQLVAQLSEAIEALSFADAEVIRRANFTSESASAGS